MNIQLPLIDGYEAERCLKADAGLEAIPVIVVTSYAWDGGAEKRAAAVAPTFPSLKAPVSCRRVSTCRSDELSE